DVLRARVAFAVSRGSDAPSLLLSAARRLDRLDAGRARDTYLEAIAAAQFAGRLAGSDSDVFAVARAALAAAPPLSASPLSASPGAASPCASSPDASSPCASAVLLDGLARLIAQGYSPGAPACHRAVAAFRHADLPRDEAIRWTW